MRCASGSSRGGARVSDVGRRRKENRRAGERTEGFDGVVDGARAPHRERAFVPVREHSRRPAARVVVGIYRGEVGNGRGAGHRARARDGVGRARRDHARASPARHPEGRDGDVRGAHHASHALARGRMARLAATTTRPKRLARASRPESAEKRASLATPALFPRNRRVITDRHQLDARRRIAPQQMPRPGTNRRMNFWMRAWRRDGLASSSHYRYRSPKG